MQCPVTTWDAGNSVCCASGHCCHLEPGDVHDPRWSESSCHPWTSDSCIAWFPGGGLGWKFRTTKKPKCTIRWKSTYTASLGPACLALWWGSIGCRDAQSEEQPFWSTVQLCCTQGHFDFCLFPAVSAIQNQALRRNLSKAVKHCFQGPLEELSPPQCCWSGRAVQWHEAGQVGTFVSRPEPESRESSHPCTCSRTVRGFSQSSLQLCKMDNTAPKAAWGLEASGLCRACKHLWFIWFNLYNYVRVLVWGVLTIAKQTKLV